MKVRGKKLTRKQKEALSAQGWDFRLYLCVRDGPDFMELVNRTTGKYIMFKMKGRMQHGTGYRIAGH